MAPTPDVKRDWPASAVYAGAMDEIASGANPFATAEPTHGLPPITAHTIHTKVGNIVVFDVHGRTDEEALQATLANLEALTGFRPPTQ